VRRNRPSGIARTRCEGYTNKKEKKTKGIEPKLWQTGCSPRPHPYSDLNEIWHVWWPAGLVS